MHTNKWFYDAHHKFKVEIFTYLVVLLLYQILEVLRHKILSFFYKNYYVITLIMKSKEKLCNSGVSAHRGPLMWLIITYTDAPFTWRMLRSWELAGAFLIHYLEAIDLFKQNWKVDNAATLFDITACSM